MKRSPMRVLFALSVLVLTHSVAWAGSATGTVNVINVSETWGGFFVQLNIPLTQSYESQCPGNWAFMSIGSDFFKPTLALLLSAKSTGEQVVIYTSGCTTVQGAPLARITTIDLGIRNGS